MHVPFVFAAIAALQATSTVAHPHNYERALAARAISRCGNTEIPASLLAASRKIAAAGNETSRLTSVNVDLYMHVVATSANKFTATRKMMNDQFAAMQNSYNPYGVTFTLKSLDYTINNAWATSPGSSDANELAMKKALRKGGYDALNLYFYTDSAPDDTLLGRCTFPISPAPAPGSDNYALDGCIVRADSVPGGSAAPYNLGITAVHEAGHWFSLFHPFQGGTCTADGDQVADTPFQSTPSFGCQPNKDSCPNAPGTDSYNNYMDYSDDFCLTKFSAGQMTRLFSFFEQLRQGK